MGLENMKGARPVVKSKVVIKKPLRALDIQDSLNMLAEVAKLLKEIRAKGFTKGMGA